MNDILGAAPEYLSAKAAWVPDAADNPECYGFYASFSAVRQVLLSRGVTADDMGQIHHLLHHAVSWTNGESWDLIVANLVPAWDVSLALPEKPRDPYYYEWRPEPASPSDEEAIERRARSIFEGQFRTAFPGQRINGKLAKEKWAKVRDQARELAIGALESEHGIWVKGNEIRDRKRAEIHGEWQSKCKAIEEKRAIIDRIRAIK